MSHAFLNFWNILEEHAKLSENYRNHMKVTSGKFHYNWKLLKVDTA